MSRYQEVMSASQAWIAHFNRGDARACAAAYTAEATLVAAPFGQFAGREAIARFWEELVAMGLGELVYRDVRLHFIDDDHALLSANWSMNLAAGVISKELWVREQGSWRLAEDDFTVLARFDKVPAHRQALLIVDMQNDYLPEGRFPLVGIEEAMGQTRRLLQHFRQQQWPVIHIQHLFAAGQAPFFEEGSEGAEIHPWLTPQSGEVRVIKRGINALIGTELAQTLLTLGIEKLVVAGAMAHLCVEGVVRALAESGYACTLVSDAIAAPELVGVSATQVCAVTAQTLGFGFAEVVETQQLLETVPG